MAINLRLSRVLLAQALGDNLPALALLDPERLRGADHADAAVALSSRRKSMSTRGRLDALLQRYLERQPIAARNGSVQREALIEGQRRFGPRFSSHCSTCCANRCCSAPVPSRAPAGRPAVGEEAVRRELDAQLACWLDDPPGRRNHRAARELAGARARKYSRELLADFANEPRRSRRRGPPPGWRAVAGEKSVTRAGDLPCCQGYRKFSGLHLLHPPLDGRCPVDPAPPAPGGCQYGSTSPRCSRTYSATPPSFATAPTPTMPDVFLADSAPRVCLFCR